LSFNTSFTTIINPYYITGLDEAMLEDLKANHDVVITLEDGIYIVTVKEFLLDTEVQYLHIRSSVEPGDLLTETNGLGVEAAEALKESTGIEATIINPYYITGLDEAIEKSFVTAFPSETNAPPGTRIATGCSVWAMLPSNMARSAYTAHLSREPMTSWRRICV